MKTVVWIAVSPFIIIGLVIALVLDFIEDTLIGQWGAKVGTLLGIVLSILMIWGLVHLMGKI